MYFWVFWTNPPVMMHDASDICNAKLMESRPLLRQICGDRSRIHVDAAQLTSYLRKIGDDGLMWEPIAGQPWMKLGLDASGVASHDDLVERYCAASMNGRFLGAVALNYLLTGDVGWKQAGEGLVTRLATLAVYRDDFAFFERSYYPPGVAPDQEAPTAKSWQALSSAWIIQGLVQFYRSTGFDPAIDLAAKLVRHQYAHSECFTPAASGFRVLCTTTTTATPSRSWPWSSTPPASATASCCSSRRPATGRVVSWGTQRSATSRSGSTPPAARSTTSRTAPVRGVKWRT